MQKYLTSQLYLLLQAWERGLCYINNGSKKGWVFSQILRTENVSPSPSDDGDGTANDTLPVTDEIPECNKKIKIKKKKERKVKY